MTAKPYRAQFQVERARGFGNPGIAQRIIDAQRPALPERLDQWTRLICRGREAVEQLLWDILADTAEEWSHMFGVGQRHERPPITQRLGQRHEAWDGPARPTPSVAGRSHRFGTARVGQALRWI